MKKTGWFVALFVAVALLAPSVVLAGGQVQWVPAGKAAKMSKDTGKKQYLLFYTEWCGYCKKMFNETLANEAVAAYLNANYVPVKINPETDKNDTRPDITPRGFPTNAFVDSSDRLITAMPGYSPPEHFLMLLKFIKTGANETMSFKEFMDQEQGQAPAPAREPAAQAPAAQAPAPAAAKERAAKAPWEKPAAKAPWEK